MMPTTLAPRDGRATDYVVPTGHQEYRTPLASGGHIEVVTTPGYDHVLIFVDSEGKRHARNLTEAEAYDVAHNLARRA